MIRRHLAPRRRTRTVLLLIGVLSAALILAGAYWWIRGGDSPIADVVDDASETLPATAWERAEPESVKSGGRLRVAVTAMPSNFNPAQAEGAASTARQILAPTTGSPVRITENGSWTVDHDYARAVDVTDERPLAIRVRLNRDAVWQDGSPITAQDMRAFWRAMSGKVKNLEVASTDGYDDIDVVKTGRDRFEYTVRFSESRSDWPLYVYPRLPADISSAPKRFNDGFRTKAVPSNGPFVVASIDAKTGTITERRNPRWWGRTPRLQRVVWRIAEPDVQVEAFEADELDAISVDAATYEQAAESGTVQRAAGSTWSHLTLNGGRGPLKDVHVRRAVAAAIDRDALAKAAGESFEAPGRTAGSLLLVPGQRGYSDVAGRTLRRETARNHLAKAGYRVRDGRAVRRGKPLTLRLPVPSDTPTTDERVDAIVDDLEDVGITVKTPTVKAARFFPDTVVPLDFDLVTFSWPASPFPVEAAEQRFRPVDSPQNYTGVAAKKLDDLWARVSATLDRGQRTSRIHDLDAALLREAVVIPLSVLPDVMVVREGLVNYGAATFEQPDFTTVGFTAVEKK